MGLGLGSILLIGGVLIVGGIAWTYFTNPTFRAVGDFVTSIGPLGTCLKQCGCAQEYNSTGGQITQRCIDCIMRTCPGDAAKLVGSYSQLKVVESAELRAKGYNVTIA